MKWFDIWFADQQSIIEMTRRNMVADLEAGYNPEGRSILMQKLAILDKEQYLEDKLDEFSNMEDSKVNRWCYYDLKKRGAIL